MARPLRCDQNLQQGGLKVVRFSMHFTINGVMVHFEIYPDSFRNLHG